MMVFKRKQIVVLSLVLMIVVAGYINYTYNKSSIAKDDTKIGEAVYVGNQEVSKSDDKSISASKQANEYFAQAKLEKQMGREQDTDALKEIAEDPVSSKEIKAKAQEQMLQLASNSEKETRVEALIKDRGFNDVIAFLGDDGSLDIVVKAPSLTSAQVAQIADAASRQAKVAISNIHVRNKF